ncbi:MAG: SlyX family protein [Pseudomonadales bacterium]|nr:SlyX family protein [Halieaceae bacterium]MCP5163946.1 SlyX family protein [Pseudomonadales bacterium]MCP5189018.1 SlyX family protein [Pseudomonadales bacterium]MCP5202995.1 SlyX family protein [Pseudomonadales bacterium]
MADTGEINALLVEVQTQLAYQEDTLRALNEALAAQQQEILVLRRQLQLLKQRQDEQGQEAPQGAPATVEKPPHY